MYIIRAMSHSLHRYPFLSTCWKYAKRTPDWACFFVLAAIFWLFPVLDIWLSSAFFSPETGWFLGDKWWANLVYEVFRDVSPLLLLLFIGVLIYSRRNAHKLPKWAPRKVWLFWLLALLLGPGLLVHGVMKESFERPRPRAVEAFSGAETHISAFSLDRSCEDCRSFVSGHAAMGFYIMVLAWPLRQRRWLYLGIVSGLGVGFVRMVQGGHFFSDAIFAGFLCYFLYRLLSKCLLGHSDIRKRNIP